MRFVPKRADDQARMHLPPFKTHPITELFVRQKLAQYFPRFQPIIYMIMFDHKHALYLFFKYVHFEKRGVSKYGSSCTNAHKYTCATSIWFQMFGNRVCVW
jgi:hypothetical protein